MAGVPKNREDQDLHYLQISTEFAGVCEDNFDLVDLYYGRAPLQAGHSEPNDAILQDVFSMRNVWDDNFRNESTEDKAIQYAILNDSIHCYQNNI